MPSEPNKIQNIISLIKDVIAALRDAVIFIVFLLLLFAPGMVNDRLVSAGFTKGSFAGMEWEAKIKSAAEETKSVGQSVDKATQNYTNLIDSLNALEKS